MRWFPSRNGNRPDPNAAPAIGDGSMRADETEDEAAVREQLSLPDDAEYALVTDYLAGELSAEDRARVEERLRTDAEFRAFAEPLIMIWNVPGPLDREEDLADRAEAKRSLQKLRKQIELQHRDVEYADLEETRTNRGRWRGGLVIGILLSIGAGLYELLRPPSMPVPVPSLMEHIDAPATDTISGRLPDGTQYTLPPGSHLSHARGLTIADQQTLTLDGEGTFIAAPGVHEPPVVVGHGVEVTGYKGRFRVLAHDSVAYVKVLEGQVSVRASTPLGYSDPLTLNDGQSVRVGPGLRIERVDPPIASSPPKTPRPTSTTSTTSAPKSDSNRVTQKRAFSWNGIIRGPKELVPQGVAIVQNIANDFGEPPGELAFAGKDTIEVTFWDPAFLRDVPSKTFAEASLPLVRKAAGQVGGVIWHSYGQKAGINVIRVKIIRALRGDGGLLMEVPPQEFTGTLTRKELETGQPPRASLTIK